MLGGSLIRASYPCVLPTLGPGSQPVMWLARGEGLQALPAGAPASGPQRTPTAGGLMRGHRPVAPKPLAAGRHGSFDRIKALVNLALKLA
ncbi:MAG: hypothetical protein EBT24_04365 [Betaproteobacteria bacterium]|nr:hypothetical protein [Betaproteobacteria bacterium]NBT10221.1 hypothetical protein [Betaproteobacteria bacterium]